MSDPEPRIRRLAAAAGVAPEWRDMGGRTRAVSQETLRALLAALRPNGGDGAPGEEGRLAVGRADQPTGLRVQGEGAPAEARLENGDLRRLETFRGPDGELMLPPLAEPGWHEVRAQGRIFRLANAPARCPGFRDLARQDRAGWGVAAQVYSLSARVDVGVGDLTGVGDVAEACARQGADLLVISPIHALRGAPSRYDSPYSPSSRAFLDPVYADPRPHAAMPRPVAGAVDWPSARRAKDAAHRQAYAALRAEASAERDAFEAFAAAAGPSLRSHALFEAIRDAMGAEWDWRDGPYRRPDAPDTLAFAREHGDEIAYRLFLQWTAERSLAAAQSRAKRAGMTIGVVADIPAGVDPAGSEVWAEPELYIEGATLGAPPDFFTVGGQDWRLTNFSPQGLAARDFEPFVRMLRANMRHAGGVRLDHVMGVQRLWMIPEGMGPEQGAYVDYPAETLLRLIDLEAWRAGALVIGEDLGILPHDFHATLADHGLTGMRLLRIQRDRDRWRPPQAWAPRAAALSATHDTMATAGWWKGADLRAGDAPGQAQRAADRALLWTAFRDAGVGEGATPPPEEGAKAVDAAFAFLGQTPCDLKLVTLEDAFATDIQPNVPGTTSEEPNWRHRFTEPPADALGRPEVAARLATLAPRK